MYTLKRVYTSAPNKLILDLWSYEDNIGYEVALLTNNIENKREFALHLIDTTASIEKWDYIFQKIIHYPRLEYISFEEELI